MTNPQSSPLDVLGDLGSQWDGTELSQSAIWHPSNDSDWELVFNDEFDGNSLNLDYWSTSFWWGGRTNYANNEDQYYIDDALVVENGVLSIVAQEETIQAFAPVDQGDLFDYTSGIVSGHDKRAFTNGYFEIRAKVPSGQGLWPAFWMLSADKVWPPEIDILEMQGHDTSTLYASLHGTDETGNDYTLNQGSLVTQEDLSQDFHTYGAQWNENEIIWYLDGVEFFRTANTLPEGAMYLLANLAVGGWAGEVDASTMFPATFDIDYIRVYQDADDTMHGGTGDDVLTRNNGHLAGEDGNDLLTVSGVGNLYGGNGDDTLFGGSGKNQLFGDAGNDLLDGGAGSDSLDGSTGNDTLLGGAGYDVLRGGDDSDSLDGGSDNDDLDGGAGNDTLLGGDGDDSLYGGLGKDSLDGQAGNDVLYGSDGADTLNGGDGYDLLDGEAGNDVLYGGAQADWLYGGAGNDALNGGADADVLNGGAGADTLAGDTGNDTLDGGADADILLGQAGVDYLYAGDGNDSVSGGADSDVMYGGTGADTLDGGDGIDVIDGEAGNDIISGGNGIDYLYGGENDDSLLGGAEGDEVYGGSGADTLFGDVGNDVLFGEAGNDRLEGGDGDDYMMSGEGDDHLDGGNGSDHWAEYADVDFVLTDSSLSGLGTDTFANIEQITLGGGDSANHINASDYTLSNLFLHGGEGNDTLLGGAEDNYLYGDGGEDELYGGRGRDRIFGGDGRDVLNGGMGYDELLGGAGNDVLTGGWGHDTLTGVGDNDGRGTVDELSGGFGRDLFVLGETGAVFYDDGIQDSDGSTDYAILRDFNAWRDRIQLSGSSDLYVLGSSEVPGLSGRSLYLDSDGSGSVTTNDELIAVVQGNANLSLNSRDFVFV
ncbi:MAG: family 16 glycosylhydrolase [Cyanobacteria bacterium J06642_2]